MAQIHFLNVGDGDCTWIKHNNGANTVIDVCLAKLPLLRKAVDSAMESFSATAVRGNFNQAAHPENPIEYLEGFNVSSVFRFVLSHPDMDHMDGIKDFFTKFQPANFWDIKHTKEQDFSQPCRYSEEDWEFYQSIRGSKDNPVCLYLYDGSRGLYYNQGDDTRSSNGLYVLSPTNSLVSEANECGDFNDCSYVILYRTHDLKILFCGDACNKTFDHLKANHEADITDVDLLIAPHHGRKGNIDFSFLDIMQPKMTFFGNANSQHLAYQEWNRRGLKKITNNQAGTLVATTGGANGGLNIYGKHETFARRYNLSTFKDDTLNAWYLETIY